MCDFYYFITQTKREREDNPECGVKDVEDCGKLPVTCFTCNLTNTCNYGDEVKVTCNFNIKSNANTPCKVSTAEFE